MQVTPHERINFQKDLADTRLDSRYIYILLPTFTNVSFDIDTQSGKDVSSGDGTGRTVSWTDYKILGNIRHVDASLVAFGHIPPGVQQGDSFFSAGLRDKKVLDKAYESEHAYIYIDGETYRVVSISSGGVGRTEEYVVGIKKFNPVFRSAGY